MIHYVDQEGVPLYLGWLYHYQKHAIYEIITSHIGEDDLEWYILFQSGWLLLFEVSTEHLFMQ